MTSVPFRSCIKFIWTHGHVTPIKSLHLPLSLFLRQKLRRLVADIFSTMSYDRDGCHFTRDLHIAIRLFSPVGAAP